MEHGVLGEARAKAFLLERFWVLERSVDFQGADYLIQRRLTSKNFLEISPPKLGVVQVKFLQDGSTYISIDKSYLCNDSGAPYGEFFLLVFTGTENSSRSFLFSSQDVLDTFIETTKDDRIYLKTKGSQILDSKNQEILDKTAALDRIDHALRNADFKSNRRFLSCTSYVKINLDHIDHDLILPLDSSYADIRKEFFEHKQRLQTVLFDIKDVVEGMQEMLSATDPEVSYSIYKEVLDPYIGTGYGMIFDVDFFNDDDFLSAVQNHKARLDAIRKLGFESKYFTFLKLLETSVAEQVARLQPIKNRKILVTATYDVNTLENTAVIVRESKSDLGCHHIVKSEPGHHAIEFLPWNWMSFDVRSGTESPPTNYSDLKKQYQSVRWKYLRPFQREIEKFLIGEE